MRVWFSPLVVLLVFTNILTLCQGKGSLTYVIDDTASMSDDINQVKRTTDSITDVVFDAKASQIQNMVLVTFNDPGAEVLVNTEDRNVFKNYVNSVAVKGGGDCPEPSLNGILLGLQTSLPESYIYVFTDASAKDYDKSTQIKNLCQKKQTQITFVLTGHCYGLTDATFRVYYDIATACSGLAFYVGKNEVDKVITTIKETISGNKTSIVNKVIPPFTPTAIPFLIDDQTEYAIVTASGLNAILSITGPDPTETLEHEIVLWVANAKVVKLINPRPGVYTANVMGHTETSVYIVGRTDFLFSHGFSELEPKSIKDTTPQPIANTKTHLSISVTDPKQTVHIVSAQILDMDEKPISGLMNLRRVSNDFYTTQSFVAPLQRFKVVVYGQSVRNGHTIKRINKIPITPQEPPKILPKSKKPAISISEGDLTRVEYGKTVKLTCKVLAYPEPKIIWTNSRGDILPSQSSTVELPYDFISYLTIPEAFIDDSYTCQAVNDKGSTNKNIEVVVKDPFEITSHIDGETVLQYGEPGKLTCDIRAPVPMHISWIQEYKSTLNQILTSSDKYQLSADGRVLTINKMDLNMMGKYSCKATLDSDSSKSVTFTTIVNINGLTKPQVTGINTQTVSRGLTAAVICLVTGVPKPTISWAFQSENSSTFVPLSESEATLRIPSTSAASAGAYRCMAHNDLGTTEHITKLIVEFPPTITSTKVTTYQGLEGDIALRIPCDAVGVPLPQVSWTADGEVIKPSAHYSIINGSLIIHDPKESDSKSYICEVSNKLGFDRVTFTAEIDKNLNTYGTIKEIDLPVGGSLKLECGADDPNESVKWFMEGVDLKINKKVFILENADISSQGNYTCHVSNVKGSYTITYAVEVGYPPKFDFTQENTNFDWSGRKSDKLDCKVDSKPTADTVWTYEGKVLSGEHSSMLEISGKWGHYTCNVSNVHGFVQKSFDVTSTKCLVKRNLKNDLTMSLFLTQESSWPVLDSNEDYLIVPAGQTVKFLCPIESRLENHFQKLPTVNEISAKCNKEDIFTANGISYKGSDFHCLNKINPTILKSHNRCLNRDSKYMRVGYNTQGFLDTYAVCFDMAKNIPLYTSVLMSKSNLGPRVIPDWYKYPGIAAGIFDGSYTCADEMSACCYAKTQLVNARDVSDGSAQRSTDIDTLNAVPYWRPCNDKKDPWTNIEDNIRSQLDTYPTFTTWTGIHKLQEKDGHQVPRYLWKVVSFDKDESVAVVYINDPSPSEDDVRCTNICVNDDVPWMTDLDEHTYCCDVDEFVQVFGLGGTSVGDPTRRTSVKVNKA